MGANANNTTNHHTIPTRSTTGSNVQGNNKGGMLTFYLIKYNKNIIIGIDITDIFIIFINVLI